MEHDGPGFVGLTEHKARGLIILILLCRGRQGPC